MTVTVSDPNNLLFIPILVPRNLHESSPGLQLPRKVIGRGLVALVPRLPYDLAGLGEVTLQEKNKKRSAVSYRKKHEAVSSQLGAQ